MALGYLGTLDIALRSGRNLTDADRADAASVILVSQRLVDQFFDGVDPLGRRITIQGESREIVGVVRDIAQTRLAGFEPIQPTVYFPMAQRPVRTVRLAIRTSGDPYQVTAPVQSAIWRVDRDQPIFGVQTLDEFIETQLAGPDFIARLLYMVGLLALALAAIGVYGVMAYSVSQQTNEIGIRMALGAKPRQVLTRVTRQGATLAGAGLLIGIPIAALIVRAITGLPVDIPGVEAGFGEFDVGPIVVVSLILAGVGLVACILPARRATQIDPVMALREE
jgi:putative ABC transport system permease protein